MPHQHCRLSLCDAIADYAQGLLTAKGAIAYWIKIHLAPGWKRKVEPKEIRDTFKRNGKEMPKSTFWNALHKLEDDGLITVDEPETLSITHLGEQPPPQTNKTDTTSQGFGGRPKSCTPSKKLDERPKKETTVQNNGQTSKKLDEQPPEPTAGKGFGSAPYSSHISSNSSQIEREGRLKNSGVSEDAIAEYESHLNSLPVDQAERFKRFLISRAKSLPKPPAIQIKWAASNWKYLWKEFQSQQSPTVATPSGFSVEEVRSPEIDQPQALDNIRAILANLTGGGGHVATT